MMIKLVHILLGIATLLIVAMVSVLGIKTFYPEPVRPIPEMEVKPLPYREFPCEKNDDACVTERKAYYDEQQLQAAESNRVYREYEAAMRGYNRNFFIIANIIGILVFIGGFLLFIALLPVSQSVMVGTMMAGVYLIIHAYIRGWGSTNDPTKFITGLIIALVVIGGSTILLKRAERAIS